MIDGMRPAPPLCCKDFFNMVKSDLNGRTEFRFRIRKLWWGIDFCLCELSVAKIRIIDCKKQIIRGCCKAYL